MNKAIYSMLMLGFWVLNSPFACWAQGNFESFVRVAHEKRFISDSYKETHLSEISRAEWIQQYDFQSLYFYAQGVKKLHGDIYLQFGVNPPDAICGGSIIVRFSEEGKLLEHAVIEVNCQQDEEAEFFLSSEFEFINDSIIEVRYTEWENVDLAFRNEKTGYSYLILGKKEIISVKADPLGASGPEVHRLAQQLLQKKDLSGLDKGQLRILRNSIFARYGYTFRSKDLDEHFSSQTWYKKSDRTSEEIMSELNPIEKINLQTIKREEHALQ